jgi:carboxyl-terminal processing protease
MSALTFTRRSICAGGLAAVSASSWASEPPHDATFIEDFDELWRTLAERYCFFDDKRTDWNKVRATFRPLAIAAQADAAFVDIVRRVLAELYDAHTHLSDPPDGAPRWPPYDVLVEPADAAARVLAIADGSAAQDAGLSIGDRIVAVDHVPIDAVARALAPVCLSRRDPAAEAYALNVAASGRRGAARRFAIYRPGAGRRDIVLPLKTTPTLATIESRRLERGVGYIVIRSFADEATIADFDRALAALRDAPGLVIDVRDNGGGDTAVARPIMGRFITERKAYARMRRRDGARLGAAWTEYVEPRGPFAYGGPVTVLTNYWSASMAEGFPMGMRDIGRARIVGTRMMGLGAAVLRLRLDRTGIEAQYSGEPVYDTKDQPRSALRPDVETRADEDILAAGVADIIAALHG